MNKTDTARIEKDQVTILVYTEWIIQNIYKPVRPLGHLQLAHAHRWHHYGVYGTFCCR